jgi:hypothetical protein
VPGCWIWILSVSGLFGLTDLLSAYSPHFPGDSGQKFKVQQIAICIHEPKKSQAFYCKINDFLEFLSNAPLRCRHS